MKRCSVSLIIRNVWIKATMRYHFTPISIPLLKKKKKEKEGNICWQGCGDMEILCTADVNVKWCSHCGKWFRGSSKNSAQNYHMMQEFLCWLYTREIRKQGLRETLILTKAKRQKQPSVHQQMGRETVWSIHMIEFCSALKRKEILKHTTRLNLEELSEITPVMLSDIRQSHRKTSTVWVHLTSP